MKGEDNEKNIKNFNYELFATIGGLACFPVGSFLINSYAARS